MLQLCVVAYTCDSVKANLGYLRPAIKQNKGKTRTRDWGWLPSIPEVPPIIPRRHGGKDVIHTVHLRSPLASAVPTLSALGILAAEG